MKPIQVFFAGLCIGFITTLSQLTLLRELSLIFRGHELFLGWTLALWVGGTAWGSGWWQAVKPKTHFSFGLLHVLILSATLFLIRWLPLSSPLMQGVNYGLLSLLLLTGLFTLPLAGSGGLWYACALHYPKTHQHQLSALFSWELLGAGLAGLLYTFFWAGYWNSWGICALVLTIVLVFHWFDTAALRLKVIIAAALGLVAGLTFFPGWTAIDRSLTFFQPCPGKKIFAQPTQRGHVALYQNQELYSLYLQNQWIFSFPWPEQNEPAALMPMLWASQPQTIALLDGNPEWIQVLLRQPSIQTIVIISEDPQAYAVLIRHLPSAWKALYSDPKVRVIPEDGRRFLEKSNIKFDMICLALPLPETLAGNRYYTSDFIHTLRQHLSRHGVLEYVLPYSPNYRLDAERRLLKSLLGNLKTAFPNTHLLAGEQLFFLATTDPTPSFFSSSDWAERFRNHPLRSRILTPAQFPVLFDPSRSQNLQTELSKPPFPVNTDAHPQAAGTYTFYWFSQHSLPLLVIPCLGLLGLAAFGIRALKKNNFPFSCTLMGAAGGMGLATELLVITAFQSTCGNLWKEIGLLLAAFMLGMGAGGWWGRMLPKRLSNPWLHFAMLASLCMSSAFAVHALPGTVMLSLILLLLTGGTVGTIYALLLQTEDNQRARRHWSADLWGSAVGGLLTNTIFVPLFGYWAGGILVFLTLIWLFFMARSAQKLAP